MEAPTIFEQSGWVRGASPRILQDQKYLLLIKLFSYDLDYRPFRFALHCRLGIDYLGEWEPRAKSPDPERWREKFQEWSLEEIYAAPAYTINGDLIEGEHRASLGKCWHLQKAKMQDVWELAGFREGNPRAKYLAA
jgi:hypothetical protein